MAYSRNLQEVVFEPHQMFKRFVQISAQGSGWASSKIRLILHGLAPVRQLVRLKPASHRLHCFWRPACKATGTVAPAKRGAWGTLKEKFRGVVLNWSVSLENHRAANSSSQAFNQRQDIAFLAQTHLSHASHRPIPLGHKRN